MPIYLKKFSEHTEYQTYINSNYRLLPNVSYCEEQNEVHFNQWTYAEEYLTFVALEDGTISFDYSSLLNTDKARYMEYSTNNGKTWIKTNNVDNESVNIIINVLQGDKILWKGDNCTLGYVDEWFESSHFSTTCRCNIMGNVMSILYGDNFKNYDTFVENTRCNLMGLFSDIAADSQSCYIVNAENLILPATTLTDYCYYGMFCWCDSLINAPKLPATTLAEGCYEYMFAFCESLTTAPELPATTLAESCYNEMFYGCTALVTAPELPATTLATYCYQYMFYGCTSLNYIKAMFTTKPSTSYTDYWVRGVAASGTFVKNSAAEWNVTGTNGIPSGWTVQTASA